MLKNKILKISTTNLWGNFREFSEITPAAPGGHPEGAILEWTSGGFSEIGPGRFPERRSGGFSDEIPQKNWKNKILGNYWKKNSEGFLQRTMNGRFSKKKFQKEFLNLQKDSHMEHLEHFRINFWRIFRVFSWRIVSRKSGRFLARTSRKFPKNLKNFYNIWIFSEYS